ncbi:MAG: SPOR domain-containing protein [Methylotenera sp.]|uniref:SPOR domain-containing protein n=1 Tax=Methylotenera sp. TaxID=2051956 RepID=UPI002717E5BB|nr:SPOR domain-containing protein [Methylotenera sp.]MDO9150649.1 SPOR domain-containing protein [Methylotenera sp.]
MSRDYKPRPERTAKQSQGNPFITGLLVGFLLGVAASLTVVMMINREESPFAELASPNKPLSEKIAESAKEKAAKDNEAAQKAKAEASETTEDKTRFDFYTILPGSERQVSTEEVKIKEQSAEPSVPNTYFLQVGAFQKEEEADNMKATLALQGFEALVQTATIPNKGVWHRVRVGPLKNLELINKTKADLAINGFKSDLITVNNETL